MEICKATFDHYIEMDRTELLQYIVPFWEKYGVDKECGGFFNYIDENGQVLLTDKNVRQLGRFVLLYTRLYREIEARPYWLELALQGIAFIERYCFDPADGRTYYEVTREGLPVRTRRYVITEHYTVMAYIELYLATGDEQWKKKAMSLYDRIIMFYHHPELLPPKYYATRKVRAHNIPMIIACTSQQMRRLGGDTSLYDDTLDHCLGEVLNNFMNEEKQALLETINLDGSFLETPEGRTINPGHSIESSWFTMTEAAYRHDREMLAKGLKILDWSLARGWDEENGGGILYFVNVDGHPEDQYEHELKLWWPQNEAVYATLLAFHLTGDKKYWDWFEKIHAYAFKYFSDHEHGEWYKYLRRDNTLSSRIKGNRWAGAFHHPRMMLNDIKLLGEMKAALDR